MRFYSLDPPNQWTKKCLTQRLRLRLLLGKRAITPQTSPHWRTQSHRQRQLLRLRPLDQLQERLRHLQCSASSERRKTLSRSAKLLRRPPTMPQPLHPWGSARHTRSTPTLHHSATTFLHLKLRTSKLLKMTSCSRKKQIHYMCLARSGNCSSQSIWQRTREDTDTLSLIHI